MELVFYLITEIYAILILGFILGFIKLERFQLSKITPVHKFSIIVPFRNEAKNLSPLLDSLAGLEYPKAYFEVLLVDDFSEDNSVQIIESFQKKHPELNLIILKNSDSRAPKKNAIKIAINKAKNDRILTTDADCKVPKTWLLAMNQKIVETNAKMICGPVKLESKKGVVSIFEILNFNSLQGATMGSFGWNQPILCNGANLCYSKQTFYEVNGFEGNETIASGDDIFLLEKIKKKYPNSIHFLKSQEGIVQTKPQESFQDFINQQQRWAAKSKSYQSNLAKPVGGIIFIQNLSLIFMTILVILDKMNGELLVFCFSMKLILDSILIYQSLRFYKQEKLAIASFPMGLVYPIFSVSIFLRSLFSNYKWKDRNFKS